MADISSILWILGSTFMWLEYRMGKNERECDFQNVLDLEVLDCYEFVLLTNDDNERFLKLPIKKIMYGIVKKKKVKMNWWGNFLLENYNDLNSSLHISTYIFKPHNVSSNFMRKLKQSKEKIAYASTSSASSRDIMDDSSVLPSKSVSPLLYRFPSSQRLL